MTALKNTLHDSNNGLDYTMVNSYYLPNLTAAAPAEQHPTGRWGRLHKMYLKEQHPIRYNQLLLSGVLGSYLAKLDKQAEEQLCAALNCPHSPKNELDRLLTNAENYISPFTVLHKDTAVGVANIIANDPLLHNRNYTQTDIEVKYLVDSMNDGATTVLFSDGTPIMHYSRDKGYPLNVIMDAVAYIVASKTGNLNGKRPRGNREEIIMNAITANPDFTVTVKVPDCFR